MAAAHMGRVRVGEASCTPFGGDALTVNGYLGSDGIRRAGGLPFRRIPAIFVLVKTSNPSSGELQDRLIDGSPSTGGWEKCAKMGGRASRRYGYSGVGAVVGATWPQQIEELRQALPRTYFLVPGYGAQGGGAADVAGAFDDKGMGAIVNSSRGILCAWKKRGLRARGIRGGRPAGGAADESGYRGGHPVKPASGNPACLVSSERNDG